MIDRNLKNTVPGPAGERLFRTLEDMDRRMTAMSQEITALRAQSNGNSLLNPAQLNQVAGLIGARSQAVFGQDVADPSLPGAVGGGTVTGVTAGDLTPLFTTTETPAPTPVISFLQITKAKNKVFAGPATGADANPDFRSLVDADMPAEEVKTDDAFTKVVAGAPYANDAYIVLKDHAGNSVRVMTTA